MTTRAALAALLAVGLAAGTAAAQGLVVPDEPELPPLALIRHDVRAYIQSQAAATTIVQVFANHTDRRLEAQYLFPVPKGASVSRFVMTVGGKEQVGEVIEKDRARQIYTQLIQRSQDPGLIEQLGRDLFRASLSVPAGAHTAVTLRYEQVLAAEHGLVGYAYPVRAGTRRGPSVQGESSLEVSIKSPRPIASVYSPSHAVTVARPSELAARAAVTGPAGAMERDFQLYYSVSDQAVGLDLVSFRPEAAAAGYFLMLVSPRVAAEPERLVERDVVFVLDTSGSMRGEKFQQAQDSLRHCIRKLNEGDRFSLVRFSSDVDVWRKGWTPASDSRPEALAWVETLMAEGGTNIGGALDAAFDLPKDPARPYVVVFLTDGKPTIGDQNPARLIAKAEAARQGAGGGSVRLFTWGVGYDVDTHLLDGLAETGGGVSEYVRPQEDIAAKVAAFCDKASLSVLSHVELAVTGGNVQLVQIYPRTLPDLHSGGQLVLVGRYTGSGAATIRLSGRVNDRTETFQYEAAFPAAGKDHAFIEPLWARRRVGYLLDTIRLRGESPELVQDVVRLSKEYGIQTPYTSYVAGAPSAFADASSVPAKTGAFGASRESGGDKKDEALAMLARKAGGTGRRAAGRPAALPAAGAPSTAVASSPAPDATAPAPAEAASEAETRNLQEGFKRRDGKAAVETADYLRRLKESGADGEGKRRGEVRKASGTRFVEYHGMWVDERFEAACAVTMVKFGSAAYFKLLEKRPELAEAFQLGTAVVIVTSPGKALVVGAEGEEGLTEEQIAAMFGA